MGEVAGAEWGKGMREELGERDGEEKLITPVAAGAKLPWQFGLKGMLLAVTALCVLFALMGAVGMLGAVVLAWFGLLAAAHVVGNAVGTRLRDDVDRQMRERKLLDEEPGQMLLAAPRPPPNKLAPVKLHENTRVSRLAIACAALGVVGGGTFGLTTLWGQANAVGVAVGAISLAILAGFFCFTAGSFMQMVGRALGEANKG
jgi:hypothetical protein